MENKTVDEKLQLTELTKDEQREISGGMAELVADSSFAALFTFTKTKQDTAKNAINNLR
ncbi:hypothetical protein [Mucilaginibacter sp. SG564]|uniref:hypothetical protein n=1 Tax=Mucilaginibacter sp. SG564 TaxID=2587022 RepID=UPI0015581274|nr:hypothetical protein [Mucilaginibacter sp. SG564]NOW98668.1 putative double-glycine peptidase [Mucilaginibacter sp. SG564]